MKISVFILENETNISDALEQCLEDDVSIGVAAVCRSTAEAITHIGQQESDLYLIDLGFTDGSGVDVISTVHTRYPRAKILAHSAYCNHRLIWSAFNAGADGYILKDDLNTRVGESITNLVNGGGFVSSQAAKVLIEGVRHTETMPFATVGRLAKYHISQADSEPAVLSIRPLLTPKELQVLELVQRGFPAKRVAGSLEISIFTVNQHVRSIYRKLNVRNKMEAVQAARRAGLL